MFASPNLKSEALLKPQIEPTDSAIVIADLSVMRRPEVVALVPALESLVSDFRERLRIFPHLCCELAATRITQLGLGLSYMNGVFMQGSVGQSHAWNMSSELGVYVDITARQFCDSLPSILVVPIDSEFAQKHYLRDCYITW